jgi:type IV secretory pathway TraG/TraD family ATPase VirD4
VSRALITPDEVRRLGANEVLIFTRGYPAIRTQRLQYHQQDFFKRRAAIAAPAQSDRLIAAPAVPAAPEEELDFLSYGVNRETKASKKELV